MVREGEWQIAGARVAPRYDVAIYGADGALVAAVEVKAASARRRTPIAEFAEQLYRNLRAHSATPHARYFLLVCLPGDVFLWDLRRDHEGSERPDFEYHDARVLDRYANRYRHNDMDKEYAAERAVVDWLSDISRTGPGAEGDRAWLVDSGLAAAISGGAAQTTRDMRAHVA
jgi:hypothetical protein